MRILFNTATVACFDRKRKDKALFNADWWSETGPDSRIAKMKDGRTHLACKYEYAVDLTSAVSSLDDEKVEVAELSCVVTYKGYHQTELIRNLNQGQVIITCIPEKHSSKRRGWSSRWTLYCHPRSSS